MAILLDLDNTLFDSTSIYNATIKSLESHAKELGFKSSSDFRKIYESVRAEVKRDLPNNPTNRLRILYFKKMSEELFGRMDPSFVLKLDAAYFRYFLSGIKEWKKKNQIEFRKILSLLRELQNGQDLVLITNESLRTQVLKLSVLFPKDIRYRLVSSEEAGAEKPSPIIFQKALYGTKNPSYLVGDSLEDDVKGGLFAGLETFHLQTILSSGKKRHSTIERKRLDGKEYWESPDLVSALNYILSLEKGILVV